MKKTLNTLAFLFLFALGMNAQVTKVQVDKMIKETGVNLPTVTYKLINYTLAYSEKPNSYKTFIEETCVVNELSLAVLDAGFEIRRYKEGKVTSVIFIPFTDVIRFSAGEGIITIVLR